MLRELSAERVNLINLTATARLVGVDTPERRVERMPLATPPKPWLPLPMLRLPHAALTPLVLALTALSLSSCDSCKKKPDTDEVKKDKSKKQVDVVDAPAPPDLLFEMTVKDPDALVKRAADAGGFAKEVGASPWETLVATISDKESQKMMHALAEHGSMAMVLTGKPEDLLDDHKWSKETVGFVAVAHVRDGELARAGLDAAVGKKGLKSHPAKGFGGTVYELDRDFVFVVVDDMIIGADAERHLEASGPYAMALARKGDRLDHDAIARITTASFAEKAEEAALAAWSKTMKDDPPPGATAAPTDAIVRTLVTAMSDLGDGTLTLDIQGNELVVDGKVVTKGELAKFLGAWPTGDSTTLLTMPVGAAGSSLYRFPDGLGPVIYAWIDQSLASGIKLKPTEIADVSKYVRVLGKSLGHELAMTGDSTLGLGMSMGAMGGKPSLEYFFRVELSDPAATKDAAKHLRELFTAAMTGTYDPKVSAAPYTKFGAEGELLTLVDKPWTPPPGSSYKPTPMPDSTFIWAVRGSYLYLDVCAFCAATLDVVALDAAAKGKIGDDAALKAKLATLPTKNVAWAFDADMTTTFTSISTAMGTAPPGKLPPVTGYVLAAEQGVEGHVSMPAQLIGAGVRAYFRAMSPSSAYPAPLGTGTSITGPIGIPPEAVETAVPPPAPKPMPKPK